MKNDWLGFLVFMMAVVSISAVSLAYYDVSKLTASCSCMSNECNLTGFALDIHNTYCMGHISVTSVKPLFSYIVVPNITCSIARDCFYNSSLMGCKDMFIRDMFDYRWYTIGWCCYDNCKLFHFKLPEDVS